LKLKKPILKTLKTLNDNFNALVKGEKKDKEKKEEEAEEEKVEEKAEDAPEDDKKTINEDKESEEVVIKEEVEEAAEKPKAKKPKAKKEKTKKRAVNIKFWYLTFDEIIDCLKNGYSTDEEISEKISCKLNIVRKILYKLYDMRLASYKRDKDKETQWYTYDWKFNEKNIKN